MKNVLKQSRGVAYFILLLMSFLGTLPIWAQNGINVRGLVIDNSQEPVIGATIRVMGNEALGTITDINGHFVLNVPSEKSILVVSFIGMTTREVPVIVGQEMTITLVDDMQVLDEVVIVGYGQQKKASVVGSITQTTGKVLERSGGVSNLGMALTGNLPGVITYSSSGMPGEEDPRIIIRTQSSWNNSDPLILVDGIERSMSSVDIASVESISVLKDASATAVYGVKGANGVILITTKRGSEGRANINIRGNMTAKVASKLPAKYDSYDALMLLNRTIERELPINPGSWGSYTPMEEIHKYRHPANAEEWDRYPNVDWEQELFKSSTMSYNANVNVSGGVKFVKYFASVDLQNEGDLFRTFENNRGYDPGFGYNRINVRSNLDFDLTKTTQFSMNLFGSNGVRKMPWNRNTGDSDTSYWASAYRTAPDAMRPIYSNGMWGWYAPKNADVPNSMYSLATSGIEKRTNSEINTDFVVRQDLSMIIKGLDFKADYSLDHSFREWRRGINDLDRPAQRMWINPVSGELVLEQQVDPGTQLDFTEQIGWLHQPGYVDMGATYRKMYYSAQLNYARELGLHEFTAMGLFSRERWARGSDFPHYREDWVFRTTYNYDMRYFAEINGAYNGSEKFGPDYRFDFFPSISGGWMISNEKFMEAVTFLDMLKVRGSFGRIGDDSVGGRWLYRDQWNYGGNTLMGSPPSNTPYSYYRIGSLGNPNVFWETAEKRNLGVEYSFLNGLIIGSVDLFDDHRKNILISGGSRSIPSYFGVTPPTANLGIVDSKGYEIELRFNHTLANGIRLWVNTNMTHGVNQVQFRDDAELLPDYRKNAGYAIGQTKAYINNDFLYSWDDVYGSTVRDAYNENKIIGDYNIVDFNGDGIINDFDRAPYQYSGIPQNTYNASLGLEWKGFSAFLQFYGVNNVTREVTFPTFHSSSHVAYVEGDYWSKDSNAGVPLPRWATLTGGDASGTRYLYDGSYLRLKNAEVAYTFSGNWINSLGVRSLRLYLNGNNLFLWTSMPDDRESNFGGGSSFGAYPTMKRFNLGIDITL